MVQTAHAETRWLQDLGSVHASRFHGSWTRVSQNTRVHVRIHGSWFTLSVNTAVLHGRQKRRPGSRLFTTGVQNDAVYSLAVSTAHEHGTVNREPVLISHVGKKHCTTMLLSTKPVNTGVMAVAWLRTVPTCCQMSG